MDSSIPALLPCTDNLVSTVSVFGSQTYPSSPLACSRAVATATSSSDNGCASARMEEALGCSGYAPVLNRSDGEDLYISQEPVEWMEACLR